MQVYVLLAMMVLLPVIPAYILFKLLESKGSVSSGKGSEAPMLGFRVQLGGAFAGYFAVLLVLLFAFRSRITPTPSVSAVWTLEGQVLDEKKQPVQVGLQNVALFPAQSLPALVSPAGGFVMGFIADPNDSDVIAPPSITVSYGDYIPMQVRLDPKMKGVTLDPQRHKIIMPPITLTRADAVPGQIYRSPAVPLTQEPAEYDKYEQTGTSAAPPGYATNSAVLRVR